MAVTSGIAVTAMCFLAIDAVTDVNPVEIAKRAEVVQASIADAAASQQQRVLAVHAWMRGSDQKPHSVMYRSCPQDHVYGPKLVGVDRGV
ncbi:hypothetical protein [Bradyrhizobium liaoningense]|uniref:hypothetical protein n=1 Tax=Bradyrhizobium liaoningense TaxID=43992 RepID=UPI001FE3EC1E|nr:hypothetical protein [Bradyrhizobium liaoningense]